MFENMKSFEERFKTFQHWPKRFGSDFTGKLAILGHFSAPADKKWTTGFRTYCIYCKKCSKAWDCNDNPFFEHFTECTVFRGMHLTSVRRKFNSICNFSCNCKAICIEIRKNKKFIFCAVCGKVNTGEEKGPERTEIIKLDEDEKENEKEEKKDDKKENNPYARDISMLMRVEEENIDNSVSEKSTDFSNMGVNSTLIETIFKHKCCSCQKLKRFNFNSYQKDNNYYIDLFSGVYVSEILSYIEKDPVEIPDDKMGLVRYVIANADVPLLSSAKEAVEVALRKLSNEFEVEMKEEEVNLTKGVL